MPHKDPFLFLESVTVEGERVRGDYKITGNEYFLEGHFKDQATLPCINRSRGTWTTLRLLLA